jgi:NAD-dependent oxidoreductase involved in siderophore biosynthesis
MAKIWETTVQRLIKQGLHVLVKEAVVPKEFKHLRRIGCSRRHDKIGVFYPTEVAYRVFPSPILLRVFFLSIYKFPLCTE